MARLVSGIDSRHLEGVRELIHDTQGGYKYLELPPVKYLSDNAVTSVYGCSAWISRTRVSASPCCSPIHSGSADRSQVPRVDDRLLTVSGSPLGGTELRIRRRTHLRRAYGEARRRNDHHLRRADVEEVAAALSGLTGERHPLAHAEAGEWMSGDAAA
ncbi:hypothetical protein ACFQ1S_02090 [Kibdelosporangium lantanae]|uniref:Uncharacterized protein n=1 Tax=Kibdelosporangium lantanae TaxID=1497396 RepID=A0ABW3M3H6_9PSEU